MRQFLLFVLILTSGIISGQGGKFIQSKWNIEGVPSTQVVNSGWMYQKQGKFYFNISNNEEKIFLKIRFEDPAVQVRVLVGGMKLWINMDNKTERNLGVHFPVGTINTGVQGRNSDTKVKSASEVSVLTALSKATTIELIGFKGEERRFQADNPDSFAGWVVVDNNGHLIYDLVLPVEKLPVRNAREGGGAMPFSFGIEYGSASEPGKKSIAPVMVWIKSIRLATDK